MMNNNVSEDNTRLPQPIYIVDAARTPFLKAGLKQGPFAAADLAVLAGRDLLSRQTFTPSLIDSVAVGCMMPSEDEANIARIIAIRLGCGNTTPAYTVQRNCASGMQALDSAMKDIQLGRRDLVLAGGTEAMSRAPLLYSKDYTQWFAALARAKTFSAKLKVFSKFRFNGRFLKPTVALLHGLTDPLCGYGMGQTAELVAYRFNITRQEMDAFSVRSHERLAAAIDQHHFKKLTTVYASNGHYYDADNGLRRDSSVEKLAKLKPNFDRKYGMVTPANSSQITDGAAMLLLASEKAVKQHNLKVMGKIVDTQWAGLDPKVMGLGPVFASTPLMQRHGLSLNDIDYWEINEAFAAQAIGCIKAWQNDTFCREQLGLDGAFGELDQARLNVDGGAIAMGHPVGASGARIVMQLLEILQRNKAKRGIATLCIGGGQGGAMLVETV